MTILLSCILFACACNSEDTKNEVKATFIGTIKEISDHNIGLVEIEEGEILKSSSSVSVKLSVNPTESFKIGDKIKVGYDGTIMESSPVQIITLSVELVD